MIGFLTMVSYHDYIGLQLFSFRFEDNKWKYRLSCRLTDLLTSNAWTYL